MTVLAFKMSRYANDVSCLPSRTVVQPSLSIKSWRTRSRRSATSRTSTSEKWPPAPCESAVRLLTAFPSELRFPSSTHTRCYDGADGICWKARLLGHGCPVRRRAFAGGLRCRLDASDDVAAGTRWSLHHLHADSGIRRCQSAPCRSSVVACASSCGCTVDPVACALACPSAVGAVVAISGRMAFGSACSDAIAASGSTFSSTDDVALVRAAGSVSIASTLAVDSTSHGGGLAVAAGSGRHRTRCTAVAVAVAGSPIGRVRAYAIVFQRPWRCSCPYCEPLASVVGGSAG